LKKTLRSSCKIEGSILLAGEGREPGCSCRRPL